MVAFFFRSNLIFALFMCLEGEMLKYALILCWFGRCRIHASACVLEVNVLCRDLGIADSVDGLVVASDNECKIKLIQHVSLTLADMSPWQPHLHAPISIPRAQQC